MIVAAPEITNRFQSCLVFLSYLDYKSAIHPLPVIKSDHGLHLKALVDIEKDEAGTRRRAGDEWQLRGPITYVPRPEVVRVCVCGRDGERGGRGGEVHGGCMQQQSVLSL